jgi:hypothetical protein
MRAYVGSLCEQGVSFEVAAEIEHRVALLPRVLAGVWLAAVTETWRSLARQPARTSWTSSRRPL